MTPWPAPENQSSPGGYAYPMQQPNGQDPFAAYGAGNGAAPQCQNGMAPQQQQQQQQQPADADPWAVPAQAPAPTQAPPAMAPAPVMAPPQAPGESTPPPGVVVADTSNQVPPSPIGDVSVLAYANAANYAAAPGAPPAVPNAMQGGVQPLQPAPQPAAQLPPAQAPPQAPPVAAANPFDFAQVASSMPAAAPPQAPPSPPRDNGQQQHGVASAPGSPLPPDSFSPRHQAPFADPFGYAFSPMTSPVGSPVVSPQGSPGGSGKGSAGDLGAMVPSQVPNGHPFGVAQGQAPAPAQQQPPNAPATQALAPAAAPNADPFGVFGNQPAPASADPFGGGALVTSAPPAAGGGVDDPFGIFGSPTPAAPAPAPTQAPPAQQQQQQQQPQAPAQDDDPWAAAGFNSMVSSDASHHSSEQRPEYDRAPSSTSVDRPDDKPLTLDTNDLPSEGEYYEARINARSLGAMFYTARNLEETLFHKMPKNVVAALGSRPVVAYVDKNSAAYNSSVLLGHIIIGVNGHEVSDPEYCANMIRNAPRPMNLRCYVPPEMNLTRNEGLHLVKYDTKDMEAPGSAIEWKRKYVVVGGIVTKPWMMNMFYRKKDYDIAVKEAHAGHKISVKVKQFDLRGARIVLKGRDGKPNWVDYPSERHPWYYITILPNKGYPIKISSESLDQLEPVYSAIRRFVRKDMETRYQIRVEESFGPGGSRGKNSSRSPSGFEGFEDAPGYHPGKHDKWR
ncbi:hypothetical protein ACHAWF_011399 [Thalassiosira exigua]